MATKRVLTHLDLGKQQLQNAVIQPLSGPPSSPVAGQVYYDSTLNQFGVYQNTTWVYLSTAQSNAAIQSLVAAMFTGAAQSPIVSTYDSTNKLVNQTIANGSVTNAMLASGISADKIADGSTNAYYTLAERSKLAGVATGATNYTDANARANRLDQFAAPTAAVAFNAQRITGVADPTAAQDASTKNYVDTGLSNNSSGDRNRTNHTGTQTASTISDFNAAVQTNRLDQLAAPTNPVSLNGQRITSLSDPTSPTDAVTKQYADGLAAGFDPKGSVRAATTGALTLSNGLVAGTVIDGYTTVAGDRILVKNQATASENGIYVVPSSGAASRSTDANTSALVTTGLMTYVENGTVNGGQIWILTTTGTITLGTTGLAFTQFSGSSTLTAGAGLAPSGNVFNVGQGAGVIVGADAVSVDFTLLPQKKLFNVGDGSATAYTLTHNLNSQDVVVSLRDASTNEIDLGVQIVATSVNAVTLTFNAAPATNAYRAVVIG